MRSIGSVSTQIKILILLLACKNKQYLVNPSLYCTVMDNQSERLCHPRQSKNVRRSRSVGK